MKTLLSKSGIITILLSICLIAIEFTATASPPPWAPANGYRAKTRYIYFPEQNVYYDLKFNNYISLNGANWSVSVNIPTIFGNLNLSNVRKVELDFTADKPYVLNKKHVATYKVKTINNKKTVVKKTSNNSSHHNKSNGNGNDKSKGKGPK